MAETDNTQNTETSKPFDETKLAELIKANVTSSMEGIKKELASQNQNRTESQVDNTTKEEPDFWDAIIDPKVNKKVASASLAAELAQDQVNFYTSDEWLSVDEWLVEEDPTKRSEEKKALRKQVEDYSANLVKQGRAMPRSDIFNAVLGEKIKKDRIKFEENIGKRNKRNEETELDKARKGVDLGSVMNDFTPESVHKMDWNKVTETYGQVVF